MNRRIRLFADMVVILAMLVSSCVKDSQPGKDDNQEENTEVGPGGDDNGDDNGGGNDSDDSGDDNGGGDNGDDNPVSGTADWLEMTSTLSGENYILNTTYDGNQRNYTHFYDKTMMTSL